MREVQGSCLNPAASKCPKYREGPFTTFSSFAHNKLPIIKRTGRTEQSVLPSLTSMLGLKAGPTALKPCAITHSGQPRGRAAGESSPREPT